MFTFSFQAGGREWRGVGFSKQNPIDEWDSEHGIDLARDRALTHGADQLLDENLTYLRQTGKLTEYLDGTITLRTLGVAATMFANPRMFDTSSAASWSPKTAKNVVE
jgi:hypothetical protein